MVDRAKKSGRRATSHDVAREAGVSRTTVSFVLNNAQGQRIPETTRTAVLVAAQRLGYTPSAAARSLRTGTSRIVLCLAPEWDPSALMDEALNLMSRNLRSDGLAVVVAKGSSSGSMDVLWSAIAPVAVVAMFDLPADTRARLEAMHVPVVDMYLYSRRQGALSDDVQVYVGRLQAEHLLDSGCHRLLSVVPRQLKMEGILHDRLDGVRSITRQLGLPDPEVIELERRPTEPVPDLIRALSRPGRVGVCAYNDTTALGVLTIARHAGLRAPTDFGVCGVDDEPAAACTTPALTTVRLDLASLDLLVTNQVREALDLDIRTPSPNGPFAQVVSRETT